jgi:hypothetical protein
MNRFCIANEILKVAKSLISASEHKRDTVETWVKVTLAFNSRSPVGAVLDIDTARFTPVSPNGERMSQGVFKRLVRRNLDIVGEVLGFPVIAEASEYAPSGAGAFGHLGGGKKGQYHPTYLRPSGDSEPSSKAYTREEAQAAAEAYHKKYSKHEEA